MPHVDVDLLEDESQGSLWVSFDVKWLSYQLECKIYERD